MDTEININNKWVETGKPVTISDVLEFEDNLRQQAEDKYLTNEAKKDLSQSQAGHALRQEWIHKVQVEINALMDVERNKDKGVTKRTWFEQFKNIDSHKLADAAISITFDATQREWSLVGTYRNMGRLIGTLVFQAVMNKNAKGRRRLERLEISAARIEGFDGVGRAERILEFAKKYGFDSDRWTNDDRYMRTHGAVLINAVLRALPDQFYRDKDKRGKDTHNTYYLNLKEQTTSALELLRNEALNQLTSYQGPMICQPRKWSKSNLGPYYRQEHGWLVPLVKNAGKEQKEAIGQGIRNGDLEFVLEALNAIQETPFSVNNYVVEAVEWVNSFMNPKTGENQIGRKIKGFPNTKTQPKDPSTDIPRAEFDKLPIKTQIILGKKKANLQRHNLSAKGAREQCNRMLGKAKSMSRFEKFWLPHNLDFRGRVYHIPDFGHHNVDFIRAMFEFANKTPVTDDNDAFIMLQLANTAGQDKLSLDERLEWVKQNETAIIAAGNDFKTTYDFWGSQNKSSFQFLAACRDWALYQDAKAKGQTHYSGLPIAMDATQSGVQHYSAAGLNHDEGRKVNILPSKRPSDFYKLCLEKAIDLISENLASSKEALEANPINDKDRETIEAYEAIQNDIGLNEYPELSEEDRDEQHVRDKAAATTRFKRTAAYRKQVLQKNVETATIALELYKKGKYTRDEIKRNAMVFCYSSEKWGMSEQLRKDWMDALSEKVFDGELSEHPFGEDDGFYAATYLAGMHYEAIKDEVTAAAKGMKFFQDVAGILASENIHVKFINRLNFPMLQDYRRAERRKHRIISTDTVTLEYDFTKEQRYNLYTDEIKADKSKSSIAPNVIHQQDSLHLMMTVLKCKDEGMSDFMVIHDSYATTVGNAKILAFCTRDQFRDLYSNYNLYEDFLEQSKLRHPNPDSVEWPEPPKQGDLDISQVIFSDYFFS